MQMLAVAMYVGHPVVVTVKVIDRARLGFQRGFWGLRKNIKSATAEGSLRTLRKPLLTLEHLVLLGERLACSAVTRFPGCSYPRCDRRRAGPHRFRRRPHSSGHRTYRCIDGSRDRAAAGR